MESDVCLQCLSSSGDPHSAVGVEMVLEPGWGLCSRFSPRQLGLSDITLGYCQVAPGQPVVLFLMTLWLGCAGLGPGQGPLWLWFSLQWLLTDCKHQLF